MEDFPEQKARKIQLCLCLQVDPTLCTYLHGQGTLIQPDMFRWQLPPSSWKATPQTTQTPLLIRTPRLRVRLRHSAVYVTPPIMYWCVRLNRQVSISH
jgi:hypothetical protein